MTMTMTLQSKSGVPTIYLDLRTNYGTVPAGSLPIGLGSPALFTALQALTSPNGNPLLTVPVSLPLAARRAVWVDAPATVDVTDGVCHGEFDKHRNGGLVNALTPSLDLDRSLVQYPDAVLYKHRQQRDRRRAQTGMSVSLAES
jgi:hypothetical protein